MSFQARATSKLTLLDSIHVISGQSNKQINLTRFYPCHFRPEQQAGYYVLGNVGDIPPQNPGTYSNPSIPLSIIIILC
jgi:hypothetical protein